MSKPSLFPSPSFRWPDHSPYCPGRPGYKGVCDCGGTGSTMSRLMPTDETRAMYDPEFRELQKLRAERDELLAALEELLPLWRIELENEGPSQVDLLLADCKRWEALIARIKGGG
jgi:hypothetical protein